MKRLMTSVQLVFACFVFMTGPSVVLANSVLATIRDADVLAELIKMPKPMDQTLVVLRCGASLYGQQNNADYTCFRTGGPERDPYVTATSHAFRMLPYTPGVVDGKPVDVWMSFSIVFDHSSASIKIYNSLIYEAPTEITALYSSPQRLLKFPSPRSCRQEVAWPTIGVDVMGKPIQADMAEEGQTLCQRKAQKVLMKSRYIPGAVNGTRVPAQYREPFTAGLLKRFDILIPQKRVPIPARR